MTNGALTTPSVPRYFQVSDGGADYTIVANNLEHAKQLLRECRVEFTTEDGDSAPIDDSRFAGLEWVELSADAAAKVNVWLGDSGAPPRAALTDCKVGDWFTTEI